MGWNEALGKSPLDSKVKAWIGYNYDYATRTHRLSFIMKEAAKLNHLYHSSSTQLKVYAQHTQQSRLTEHSTIISHTFYVTYLQF